MTSAVPYDSKLSSSSSDELVETKRLPAPLEPAQPWPQGWRTDGYKGLVEELKSNIESERLLKKK